MEEQKGQIIELMDISGNQEHDIQGQMKEQLKIFEELNEYVTKWTGYNNQDTDFNPVFYIDSDKHKRVETAIMLKKMVNNGVDLEGLFRINKAMNTMKQNLIQGIWTDKLSQEEQREIEFILAHEAQKVRSMNNKSKFLMATNTILWYDSRICFVNVKHNGNNYSITMSAWRECVKDITALDGLSKNDPEYTKKYENICIKMLKNGWPLLSIPKKELTKRQLITAIRKNTQNIWRISKDTEYYMQYARMTAAIMTRDDLVHDIGGDTRDDYITHLHHERYKEKGWRVSYDKTKPFTYDYKKPFTVQLDRDKSQNFSIRKIIAQNIAQKKAMDLGHRHKFRNEKLYELFQASGKHFEEATKDTIWGGTDTNFMQILNSFSDISLRKLEEVDKKNKIVEEVVGKKLDKYTNGKGSINYGKSKKIGQMIDYYGIKRGIDYQRNCFFGKDKIRITGDIETRLNKSELEKKIIEKKANKSFKNLYEREGGILGNTKSQYHKLKSEGHDTGFREALEAVNMQKDGVERGNK